ncbi:unnamed protein product [Cyberlindnera jadinii]|uniref:Uncharacterized protein n=1 Tax=Cyberlindnera jadinii (strain ATCC 18201 / CBS 1600 / BCRC 20928 / JCM 3617 / NBRC 0987 / NRRL Y-1542) TaxID=983966 RepID=A0A0H5BY75_CYBJN|nr:unnamed protein product [Cyberlindnera jadinii]
MTVFNDSRTLDTATLKTRSLIASKCKSSDDVLTSYLTTRSSGLRMGSCSSVLFAMVACFSVSNGTPMSLFTVSISLLEKMLTHQNAQCTTERHLLSLGCHKYVSSCRDLTTSFPLLPPGVYAPVRPS